MEEKIKNLLAFAQGIYQKENGKELYNKYLKEIEAVTPQDIFLVENEQLKRGLTPRELLVYVDKLINVFYLIGKLSEIVNGTLSCQDQFQLCWKHDRVALF